MTMKLMMRRLSTTATIIISTCFIATTYNRAGRINAQELIKDDNNDNIDYDSSSIITIIPTTLSSSSNSRSLIYTPQQCDSWVATALSTASDASSSSGLSQIEYLTFLQSIISPPYVGQYFESFSSFIELPYDARISNKILSCACSSLPGYDKETCCSGSDNNAELPLAGFRSGYTAVVTNNTDTTTTTTTAAGTNGTNGDEDVVVVGAIISKEELAYRTYFCEILGNLVSRVPVVPTTSPSTSTTSSSPSLTSSSSSSSSNNTPSQSPSKSPFHTTVDTSINEPDVVVEKKGLSTGAMIGIIFAILVAILVAILMRQLRKDNEPGKENNHEEVEGGADRKDDASSSDPSVWSESEERNKSRNDETNNDDDDDVEEQRLTEGSAVAAIGIASTVVTKISSPKRNSDVV